MTCPCNLLYQYTLSNIPPSPSHFPFSVFPSSFSHSSHLPSSRSVPTLVVVVPPTHPQVLTINCGVPTGKAIPNGCAPLRHRSSEIVINPVITVLLVVIHRHNIHHKWLCHKYHHNDHHNHFYPIHPPCFPILLPLFSVTPIHAHIGKEKIRLLLPLVKFVH